VPLELAQRFGVGYASPSREIAAATPEWSQWARRYWVGRLVFPLYNALGCPIGMQTRSVVAKDYRLFYAYPAALHPWAFGLPQALPAIWDRGHVVLVEGVFDALAVAPVCDCVLGTLRALPSRALVTFLARYALNVTSLLDMDDPGRAGGLALLRDTPRYTVTLPSYPAHDPAEWVAANGYGPLVKLLSHTLRSLRT
jgi:DNA primase